MRELFVYYGLRDGTAQDARAAVLAMHDELRELHPGLVARLLGRRDASGAATWMETYAVPGADVDSRIESAIAARALRLVSFIEGTRHVEAFDGEE